MVKNLPAMQEPQETQVQSLGPEDSLEEDIAAHSSILAWRIPWTEKPRGPQSVGLQRLGHDLVTKQIAPALSLLLLLLSHFSRV